MNNQTATFYLLNQDSPSLCYLALCRLLSEQYRQGLRIFVLAQDKTAAESIDELLWQLDADQFVPHCLVGEDDKHSSAVEIGWQGSHFSGSRQLLINLTENVANFAPSFAQVVDFVPYDEALKQKARDRYRIYSMAGRTIRTLPMPSF